MEYIVIKRLVEKEDKEEKGRKQGRVRFVGGGGGGREKWRREKWRGVPSEKWGGRGNEDEEYQEKYE